MITYAMKSSPGDRDVNEDYIYTQENGTAALCAVADGLGGCGHGDLAARTAVKSVFARYRWDSEQDGFLDRAMFGAQQAVIRRQNDRPEAKEMGSTLVVLKIEDGIAEWAHIGDSRLYFFHKKKIVSQTTDHSAAQLRVLLGELKPDEIRHHPDRNLLVRSIGTPWVDESYDLSEKLPVEKGDAFLLCSDGFWEFIEEKEMVRCLKKSRSADIWLKQMLILVEKAGKKAVMDNYSAICIYIS